jgi:hypothetical protein
VLLGGFGVLNYCEALSSITPFDPLSCTLALWFT